MQSADVLLIEDNDHLRRSMTRSLEAAGFSVQAVRDGRSGLALLDAERPDLVWLDLTLGEFTGSDGLRAIRRDDATVPVILVTGQVTLPDMEGDADLSSDDLVAKPFYPQELVLRVQRVLKKRTS